MINSGEREIMRVDGTKEILKQQTNDLIIAKPHHDNLNKVLSSIKEQYKRSYEQIYESIYKDWDSRHFWNENPRSSPGFDERDRSQRIFLLTLSRMGQAYDHLAVKGFSEDTTIPPQYFKFESR